LKPSVSKAFFWDFSRKFPLETFVSKVKKVFFPFFPKGNIPVGKPLLGRQEEEVKSTKAMGELSLPADCQIQSEIFTLTEFSIVFLKHNKIAQ